MEVLDMLHYWKLTFKKIRGHRVSSKVVHQLELKLNLDFPLPNLEEEAKTQIREAS